MPRIDVLRMELLRSEHDALLARRRRVARERRALTDEWEMLSIRLREIALEKNRIFYGRPEPEPEPEPAAN